MKHVFGLAIVFSICLVACTTVDNTSNEKTPLKKADIYFESIPADSSGLNFSNDLFYKDELNIIEYLYYYNGGGVAIGDINNDGLDDIYLTANQTSDKLFLNQGNLKFKDITEESKINLDSTWSTGVTMEDVNNDGYLDIYVSKVGKYKTLQAHNLLYINKKDGTFIESSKAYGLDFSGFSTQASFFDYDNDGDMDMYLMNHAVHTPRSYGDVRIRQSTDSIAGDRLFENQLNLGKNNFIDVSKASGIYSSSLGYGLALTTSDINNDGLVDIYVGNDFHENDYLYINQGDKTFKESMADYISHNARFTMGVDISDINNDQKLDIMTLDMMPNDSKIFLKSGGEDSDKVSQIKENYGFGTQYARNTLQLNNNNESFSDIALMTETHATDWSWSTLIQDYNNDSQNDIYISNGIYKRPNDLNYINYLSSINFAKYDQTKQNEIERKLIDEMPTINISNVVFQNNGNLEFKRYTREAGLKPSYSNGAAYSDLDNDGDLDVVVNNINENVFLLENKSKTEKYSYISLSIKGDSIFKNPTGAKVYLYAEDQTYMKELLVTRGFQSSVSHKIHFGLGTAQRIDSVQVHWLDGKVQTERGLSINEENTIMRNSSLLSDRIDPLNNFTSFTKTFPFVHIENPYLDYERESLMPEKLSTEGPAVIKADFNGDNLDDIFIGGAKHQAPSLYVQQKNGSYTLDKTSDFMKDTSYEDVDVEVFDIDNDGDLDLYVMSGGNETTEGSPSLEDRIYINNGKAHFTRLNASLIKTNGGSVSAGDYNGDGFKDLFIGNRSIPGGYGLSPESYILKNNGKSGFSIVKNHQFGMVTDSKWADINNDQLLDLIVVGDWMPISIYINKGNDSFVNETENFSLEDSYGMWNSVLVEDLNGDGILDIVAGNAGLNFKIKASSEYPMKLYLDDFDNNSQPDPIIFYNFFGKDVPFASRDKLASQIPSLKKKFLNYSDFANISGIENLFDKKIDSIYVVKKITELRSMVYLNSGSSFTPKPLPIEAQMSTVEDVYLQSTQAGNHLIFVGNYLGYTTELGKSDANSGGIIRFNELGDFEYVQSLDLPLNLNARKVIKLNENRFLVVANNDKSYSFQLPIQTK